MKVLRIVAVIFFMLIAAYVIFITTPVHIHKRYQGAILKQTQMVQEAPIAIDGNLYRGLFNKNEFVGTLRFQGKTYRFTTAQFGGVSPIHLIRLRLASMHSQYPYFGQATATDRHGHAITTMTIFISGNFTDVFGSTLGIENKYGRQAFFRSPVDLNMTDSSPLG